MRVRLIDVLILPAMIRSLGVAALVTAAVASSGYLANADATITHVAFAPGPVPRAKIATAVSVRVQGIGPHRDLTAATCFCELSIQKLTNTYAGPAQRFTLAPSSHGSYDELRAVVRFPEPGRYLLRVRGFPKYIGSFEPFSVLVNATVTS
jgi:hypothetical protein